MASAALSFHAKCVEVLAMRKKPKIVQVGSHEYFNALLTYYTNRSTAIMQKEFSHAQESIDHANGGVPSAETTACHSGEGASVPTASVSGSVSGQGHKAD